MPVLKIKLFGGTRVANNTGELELAKDFPRSLFAYLSINPGKIFQREYLSERLWPDSNKSRSRGALNTALWRLRNIAPIARRLITPARDTVCFAPTAKTWVDVVAFERKCDRAIAMVENDPRRAIHAFQQALALYSQYAFCDIQHEWAFMKRTRLENRWLDALFATAKTSARLEDWVAAETHATRLLAHENFREEVHRLRILAVLRQGDRLRAQMLYEELCEFLMNEIGERPMFRLDDCGSHAGERPVLKGGELMKLRGLVSDFSSSLDRFESELNGPVADLRD